MSIHSLNEDDFEFFTIETHPLTNYSTNLVRDSNGAILYYTGSNGNMEETFGPTGSVYVYANRSPVEKEVVKAADTNSIIFEDSSLEQLRIDIATSNSTNKQARLQTYLSGVFASSSSLRKQKKQEIIRFTPNVKFNSNTLRKTLITNHLMPFYRPNCVTSNFNFTNYNSINFFNGGLESTSHPIPSSSVLLYPNPQQTLVTSGVYTSQYGHTPSGAMSFDFWINPKYTIPANNEYKAGCILHLTGAYAISLHTGSHKDPDGKPDKFRIMLQLSDGADTRPSLAVTGSKIFMSDDNILNYNTWHHVTIRHGGVYYNNNSGSFFVDGVNAGNFTFSEPSFGLYDATASLSPSVLCVGNYYNGVNILDDFFNADSSLRDGLLQLSAGTTDPDFSDFDFSNPLQAEVHDLKIYDKYLTTTDINELQVAAPKTLSNIKFYLPPFFTEESPYRQFVGTYGGVMRTPFFEVDGTTTTPYNAELAFSSNGHYINLENYTRDFITGRYPRLWFLTGSSFEPPSSVVQTADYFLYSSGSNAGSNKRRLYTIIPCDHGGWNPNFDLLRGLSGSLNGGRYSNDLGNTDIGHISLRDIVTGSFSKNGGVSFTTNMSGTIVDDFLGAGPESGSLATAPGNDLTIFNRLRDGDSNQVVVVDISNLYYGMRIKPKSLILTDSRLSGSDGQISMTIKDDGEGNLYRADSLGTNATWASIGNIFYNEGLVFIKSPQLFYFGKEGFDVTFQGVQNIHTTTYNCYARPLELLSSSNKSWSSDLKYDEDLANEPDQGFVYITGINIHDENLNVIMKARLAQPVAKKSSDKILFKISKDW